MKIVLGVACCTLLFGVEKSIEPKMMKKSQNYIFFVIKGSIHLGWFEVVPGGVWKVVLMSTPKSAK